MIAPMPSRRLALLALVPVAGAVLVACGSGGNVPLNAGDVVPSSSAAPSVVVLLRYASLEPSRVTIHVGQTVQWRWEQAPFPGNVTFATFASPTMTSGTWSHTFSQPGTYPYRNSLRQEATGVVVVQP
jgi:plastocyanin